MHVLEVANAQEAEGAEEAEGTPGAEGIGVAEGRWLCWWATWRILAGDGLLCLAQLDLRGTSLLKTLRIPK